MSVVRTHLVQQASMKFCALCGTNTGIRRKFARGRIQDKGLVSWTFVPYQLGRKKVSCAFKPGTGTSSCNLKRIPVVLQCAERLQRVNRKISCILQHNHRSEHLHHHRMVNSEHRRHIHLETSTNEYGAPCFHFTFIFVWKSSKSSTTKRFSRSQQIQFRKLEGERQQRAW